MFTFFISLIIGIIVALIVAKLAYNSVIKISGNRPVGLSTPLLTMVLVFIAFIATVATSIGIIEGCYNCLREDSSFQYREEIPIENIIVNSASVYYIALDGTTRSDSVRSGGMSIYASPDDQVHLFSLYSPDKDWAFLDNDMYRLVAEIPLQDGESDPSMSVLKEMRLNAVPFEFDKTLTEDAEGGDKDAE